MWIDQTDYHLTIPVDDRLDSDTVQELRRIVSDGRESVDHETAEGGILHLRENECRQGSSLEKCEVAADALRTGGADRPLRVWSTPYETLGTLTQYAPGLGIHTVYCDDEATPYLPDTDLLDLLDLPRPQAARYLVNRLGTPWRQAYDTYGTLDPSNVPDLGEQHRADLARAHASGATYQTAKSLLLVAYDYLDAHRAYIAGWRAAQDQQAPSPTTLTGLLSALDRCTLIREALHRRNVITHLANEDALDIILTCGSTFTLR